MSMIGRALARLGSRTGGQLMLELPDDLQPTFVAGILHGANSELPATPPYCLFVHGERKGPTLVEPDVDFRELAMYRQGSHLAVAFASENRGMATYSSVYPLLLSNGFPSSDTAHGGTGVGGLNEFSTTLAEIIAARSTCGLPPGEFRDAVHGVLKFLADAYESIGNGQSSFAADWWLHVQLWTESLELIANTSPETTGVGAVYGCAGLPVPTTGSTLAMSPKEYIGILRARWHSPPSIMAELGRLQGIDFARVAADFLAKLDWEGSLARIRLRSDSPIAYVALATGTDPLDRIRGWASLQEVDFAKSYVDAKGKLTLRRFDSDLPCPWKNALPVIIAKLYECSEDPPRLMALEDVELIVPYKDGADRNSVPRGTINGMPGVQVRGTRGCSADLDVTAAEYLADGLHLRGKLTVVPAKKAPNLAWIEAITSGDPALFVADKCDGSFTTLGPAEAAIWAKPQGRAPKSSMRGPEIWSRNANVPETMELPGPNSYEFAIAWGSEAGLDGRSLALRTSRFNLPWAGLDHGAKGTAEITEEADVVANDAPIFHIALFSSEDRPLSPIVAAARGLHPDTRKVLADNTLSRLEARFGESLSTLSASQPIGCLLATNSRANSEFVAGTSGAWCTQDLRVRPGTDLSPGFPSQHLLTHPAYIALLEAYKSLGIPEQIASIEKEEEAAGLTISRIALDFIPKESMDDLLKAYKELLAAANSLSPTDRFWARNPFSLVVFPEGLGFQSAQAILLSPLHPIRLAWAWGLQVGLREAHDDGANPSESLALLDGTNFPAFVVTGDRFGRPMALMPVPVDARPDDLYLGWHASVAITENRAAMPEWIGGMRFPVDGISALSESSISTAVDDFLRVSPHVQSLQIELAAATPLRRSSAIDEGIRTKLGELAMASTGLDGVAGIRVLDSEKRLGSIPGFAAIEDAITMARPGFNVEWVSTPEGEQTHSHVTFLEGSAALLSMDPSSGPGTTWLPNLPLRRTPVRFRPSQSTILDYSLADPGVDGTVFAKTLFEYESGSSGSTFSLNVLPNPIGITGRPNWLVAGDFGVDPRALSQAARDQANSDYILWDWRPATTIKPNRNTSSRAQPYFVLASIPPSLSNAIHSRLRSLRDGLSQDAVGARTRLLVSTLSERAIGLNTLLAIGHHQATGALGFFFALRSIGTWLDSCPAGEIRLVIPVDAVDPFLRSSTTQPTEGSRKRADLLAIRAWVGQNQPARVALAPVEIKHYGLGDNGQDGNFPLAGEPRLAEHVEQLKSYQEQLEALCTMYRNAAGSQASLLGQRLAAVLDAAIQLSTTETEGASRLLRDVSSGRVQIELGAGLLFWYQARASGMDGTRANWEEISGTSASRRNDVHIDPAAFDGCFWNGEEGIAHQVVREALDNATDFDSPTPLGGDPTMAATPIAAVTSPTLSTSAGTTSAPKQLPGTEVQPKPPSDPSDASGRQATPPSRPSPRKKLSESELEKRYAGLITALGEFNVKVERPRGQRPYQEGPAFIEYAVFPSYGVSVSRIESQLDNLKLRLKLASDAEIGCSTHMGNVLLTVPKSDEERYFVDATELWSRWPRPASGFKVPVGEDASGDIVEIDFANSNSPHLLIAGVTGSGKSEALLTILHGACRYYGPEELRLRLIDPKQTELNTLANLPHTQGPIGWSGAEAISILEEAVEEMERRYGAFRESGPTIRNISEYQTSIGPMARWMIVLDEYADLLSDDAERKQIEKYLQRLSQKARAAGIHVIVSTQKPVVQVVNTVVKGNLPGKIALRVNTAMESRVILDETGAEQLVGKGDAIIRAGNSKARIQFARYAI